MRHDANVGRRQRVDCHNKFRAQPIKTAREQLLLGFEVRVEGRAANVRPVQYIFDADRIIVALADQRDKGVVESRTGACDPAVDGYSRSFAGFRTLPCPGAIPDGHDLLFAKVSG